MGAPHPAKCRARGGFPLKVPQKILIVKLSSLGDVVHAMPAVQDLRAAFPRVRIDWVVERGFAPLVARCEGVARVIPCDIRAWSKKPFAAVPPVPLGAASRRTCSKTPMTR